MPYALYKCVVCNAYTIEPCFSYLALHVCASDDSIGVFPTSLVVANPLPPGVATYSTFAAVPAILILQ